MGSSYADTKRRNQLITKSSLVLGSVEPWVISITMSVLFRQKFERFFLPSSNQNRTAWVLVFFREPCSWSSVSLSRINKTHERCRIHYSLLTLEITVCTAPGLFTAASVSINIHVKRSPHIFLLPHPSRSLTFSLSFSLGFSSSPSVCLSSYAF